MREPLHFLAYENFSRFHLQDKHNASIKWTWHTKSESKNREISEYIRGILEKNLQVVLFAGNTTRKICYK